MLELLKANQMRLFDTKNDSIGSQNIWWSFSCIFPSNKKFFSDSVSSKMTMIYFLFSKTHASSYITSVERAFLFNF